MEPFKIKSIQSINFSSVETRKALLKKAKYNVFKLKSEDVYIDLLTDSGTGAMSLDQWASLTNPGFSSLNSSCIQEFKKTIRDITGFKHVFPAHQGRAGELIFFKHLLKKGDIVISNSLFDTTRAHVESSGAEGIDLPDSSSSFPGDIDLVKFYKLFNQSKLNIRLVIITCTNNTCGGSPVSMENIKLISTACREKNIPILIDACRFAENAYFIKIMDNRYASSNLKDITREMFSYFDGTVMSLKKDGLSNMGGFLASNNDSWAELIADDVLTKGSSNTYGGMTAEDVRACTIGLREVMSERYLQYRVHQTKLLGQALLKYNVPILQPVGGHAVYVVANKILPHLSFNQFPAWAVTCAVYIEGGIRSVELGNIMFGMSPDGSKRTHPYEYVRLAIPRRKYTLNHLLYVAKVFGNVTEKASLICGMRIVKASLILRHFTAELEPEQEELISGEVNSVTTTKTFWSNYFLLFSKSFNFLQI